MSNQEYDIIVEIEKQPQIGSPEYKTMLAWIKNNLLEVQYSKNGAGKPLLLMVADLDYFELVKQAEESNINKTWDAYTDLRKSPILGGGEGQTANPTYFSDSVHLLCDGYKELADFVYQNAFLKLFEES